MIFKKVNIINLNLMEVTVNELKKNITYISIIIMLSIVIFIFGTIIYSDRKTISEITGQLQYTIQELQSVENSLDANQKESEYRESIIENIQSENSRYRETEKSLRNELDKTLAELERIRKENTAGIGTIEEAGDEIKRGLAILNETIREIKKNKHD